MRRLRQPRPAPTCPTLQACPQPPASDLRRALLGGGVCGGLWGALGLLGATPARAAGALGAPKGKVVLSVVGRVGKPNAGAQADFDMAMIEALPGQQRIITRTPWFPGPRTFSGPLLRDVLAEAGAEGTQLRAVALNSYKVNIPVEDIHRFSVLLATRMEGQPMAVRDKGPLFIVYPYDADSELRSERYYSRSAWQLRTLEVR